MLKVSFFMKILALPIPFLLVCENALVLKW